MTELQRMELTQKANLFVFQTAQNCATKMLSVGIPIREVSGVLLYPTNKTHARCYYSDGEFLIVIDDRVAKYIDDDTVKKHITDSIYHELLHTCDGCMEHNTEWIKWAKKCDAELGTHTMQYMEDDIYFNTGADHITKHTCPTCGFEYIGIAKRNIKCQCCRKSEMVVED